MKIQRVYMQGTQNEVQHFVFAFDNLNEDMARMRKEIEYISKRQLDIVNLVNRLWMELNRKEILKNK